MKSGSRTALGTRYQFLIYYNIEKCIVLAGIHIKEKICFVDDSTQKLKKERYRERGNGELVVSLMVFINLFPFFLFVLIVQSQVT